MAKKRSTKTKKIVLPKVPRFRFTRAYAYAAVRVLFLALLISTSISYGKRGIPAARQEGCEIGAQGAVGVLTGGQRAPEDQIATFCKDQLSK